MKRPMMKRPYMRRVVQERKTCKLFHLKQPRLFLTPMVAHSVGQAFTEEEMTRLLPLHAFGMCFHGLYCEYEPGVAATPGAITLSLERMEFASMAVEPVPPEPKKLRLCTKTSNHSCGIYSLTGRWRPVPDRMMLVEGRHCELCVARAAEPQNKSTAPNRTVSPTKINIM